ncbi:hypothetical protein R3P38DRAFT_3225083 [Favolaschia claudopus]|uniref:Uncharacterized protein n=1 Tax=Favolaschia claudopus TaxID=2862362 RepID=A0AAV9ZVE0_9AGAR
MPGAGLSHGEGIEHNWSVSNGAAGSTRLMSQANRAITLEDIFGFHNYDRTLAMHRIVAHRLAVAMKEGIAHAAAFEAFTEGPEAERPEQVQEWREWVERWEATQHTTAEDSPFEFAETEVKTLRDIQLQIASEEFVATGAGVEVEREHTPGTFITLGLDIEQTHLDHKRGASVRSGATRGGGADARGRGVGGQGLLTRGQGMLRVINIRIHLSKLRYRYSRAALLALRGHGSWEERLRVLADDDVRALNERALTNEEKAQNEHWAELGGAIVEGGVARAAGVAAGEDSHTLSWIWYRVGSGEAEGDELLEEALRVEWCKAYARTKRYDEEVRLVREEMRCTIAYGVTAEREWRRLAGEELAGATAELTEGQRAYAAEHAETKRARCADLEKRWRPILRKADVYLKESSGAASEPREVTVEVVMEDEMSP